MNAEALLPRAEALGSAYAPGNRFLLDDGGEEAARLAFSYYDIPNLTESVRLLGDAIRALPNWRLTTDD
ncbi:MAG: hypothetical protein U0841_01200 [Chloroflexia bacterium]